MAFWKETINWHVNYAKFTGKAYKEEFHRVIWTGRLTHKKMLGKKIMIAWRA